MGGLNEEVQEAGGGLWFTRGWPNTVVMSHTHWAELQPTNHLASGKRPHLGTHRPLDETASVDSIFSSSCAVEWMDQL